MGQLSGEERHQLQSLMSSLAKHVSMAAFIPNRQSKPDDIIMNGTVSFVRTPEKHLLLTSAHVWTTFLEKRAAAPDLELVLIGQGEPIAITHAPLIAIDSGRDLAILACDNPAEAATIGKAFYEPKTWPIEAAAEGDNVVFVGFPGMHRSAHGMELRVVASLLAPVVVGVSDRALRLEFTSDDKIIEQFKEGLKPFGPSGGVSGSALYRLIPETNKLDLTGCVFGAANDLAVIMAAKLDCLRANGALEA